MFTCCSIKTESLPGGGISLRIDGAATQEHERELYRAVYEAIKVCDCLEIRCDRILEADYTFVMLICAAHRTTKQLGKRLVDRESLPEGALHLPENARHTLERGCLYAPRLRCKYWRFLIGADAAGDSDEIPVVAAGPALVAAPAKAARRKRVADIQPAGRARRQLSLAGSPA